MTDFKYEIGTELTSRTTFSKYRVVGYDGNYYVLRLIGEGVMYSSLGKTHVESKLVLDSFFEKGKSYAVDDTIYRVVEVLGGDGEDILAVAWFHSSATGRPLAMILDQGHFLRAQEL